MVGMATKHVLTTEEKVKENRVVRLVYVTRHLSRRAERMLVK